MLTSGKEKKYVTSPSKLNLAVTRDTLGIFTFHNTPEVLYKLAPPGGQKECAVVCFVLIERLSSFIQNKCTKQVLAHSFKSPKGANLQCTLGVLWKM